MIVVFFSANKLLNGCFKAAISDLPYQFKEVN